MATRNDHPLVSILIGLAVIAVLAAIGIPALHNNSVSNHVEDALKATDAAKLVVMEAATTNGGLARIKASDLKYNPAAAANAFVARVEIADGGNITLTTKDTGGNPDPILLLVPSDDSKNKETTPIHWSCRVIAGDLHAIPDQCNQDNNLTRASSAATAASPATTASPNTRD